LSEAARSHVRHETGPQGPVLFALSAAIVAFAPLVRGGNRPMALLVLELAGLALLACLAWMGTRAPLEGVPAPLRWAAALLVATPLVQLLPVPMAWWALLPGHAPFAQVLETAGEAAGWRPMTIHPVATQYSWLVMIPCVAIFVAVRQLDRSAVRRLAMVFAAVACMEAIAGVLQAGSTPGSAIHLGNPYGGGAATGTYINKNHFAALMAMALPLLLSLWAIEMLPVVTHRGEVLREHPRNADTKFAMRALFSALAVVLLLALFLSRSRAGIAAGMLAFGLATLALVWRTATAQVKVVLAMVAGGALLLAACVGLTPALDRFAPDEVAQAAGGRWTLTFGSLNAALDFMPLGSGLGTFADVFRRYQGSGIIGFADHAHNDYAELLVELGIAGLAVMALMLAAYAMRWRPVLASRHSRRLRFLQVGAGLGMLAMIVHGLFDFNFHIPANAISFSLLAGIFFFTPAEDRA
jgi:O-antigen ligase